MNEAVRAQYEGYPYPPRDPKDEADRLIEGSPSDLDELDHYVFAGRLDRGRPLRALVAGGGTGDGLIMLAQHCADAGVPADITYVDVSRAARATAEARAAARGLTFVRFLTGSLLDLADLAPGPYDYIDCCGVLHHLDDPQAGLRALTRVLAPHGGMGLMLYGPYGRTGVYPLQSALRRLDRGLADGERLALGRRLVADLPDGNWFKRNPLVADHMSGDAGLYDLLLHSRDRAYTVSEIFALAEDCGLAVTAFIEPLRYAPESYLHDPVLLGRLGGLAWPARAALAEELAGTMKTHVFYAVPRDRAPHAVARPDAPTVRPVLRGLDVAALARSFKPGQRLTVDVAGVKLRLPLPPLAGAMLPLFDGCTDLRAAHAALAAQGTKVSWEAFERQFAQLYAALNGINTMTLRT